MFALRHTPTGQLLGVTTDDNSDGEFCVSVAHNLELDCGNVWVVFDKETAERAIISPTPWYNATYDTPDHGFDEEVLEVVELTVVNK